MHTCRINPCHAKLDNISVLIKDRIVLDPLESLKHLEM